ncbi:tyrosyl-tRNA synthetase [Salsuginibacillus halophilus]|uniref:Tyrosine--tRNA ligase n=1 Tax=Salsuginibacillus halophilus TaxID=517424 RepID=A0A2P8HE97_9BACI|nr:tyrosine--tRNA ligase [Salsuginibacillus halophilus]PSL44558.1 tyrosyl-tRNA synthetase [Salsuginibacillus halophilus]
MNILHDLEKRGLVNQVTDRENLAKLLENEQVKLYCGFDPTGDSLHIGHLLTIMTMRRFQLAGHRPYALVGGATGLIGDPSGKSAERTLNEEDVVQTWVSRIQSQLAKYLDFEGGAEAKLVNNYDWLGELRLVDFLRDVGKHFSVNYMLAKETVGARLESGISYTEFTYMMLQSYDFYKLNEEEGIKLQMGGSDQWGNITAGLELMRRMNGQDEDETPEAFGFTIPLVTKADGQKFGKSEGGAIWLDPAKTSPYEFYQFLINTSDDDVIKFLWYFTFLDESEIERLSEEVQQRPEIREAQKKLAEEVTRFVHGEDALEQAQNISRALFGDKELTSLTADEIEQGFKDVPGATVEDASRPLPDLLVDTGIAGSKRQAREDIQNGAIYINGTREQSLDKVLEESDQIGGKFTIVRRGKKKYYLLRYA